MAAKVVVSQSASKKKKAGDAAEQKNDKTATRAMWTKWTMLAVVVFLILTGMGRNRWTHPDWAHGA